MKLIIDIEASVGEYAEITDPEEIQKVIARLANGEYVDEVFKQQIADVDISYDIRWRVEG